MDTESVDVKPYTGSIRNIDMELQDEAPSLMVVEESEYIRWWHLYVSGIDGWVYPHSRQVFLEPWERLVTLGSDSEGSDVQSLSILDDSVSDEYRSLDEGIATSCSDESMNYFVSMEVVDP